MGKKINFLAKKDFKHAVNSLPLVSIDICFIKNRDMLLGKRNNKPAKNFWFSPGGRIRKDEQLSQAFKRIVSNEVGLKNFNIKESFLMGVWDHFYEDSAYSDEITTHYINLPHYYIFKDDLYKNLILPKGANEQHSDWLWLPLEDIIGNPDAHKHVRVYAKWILDNNVI